MALRSTEPGFEHVKLFLAVEQRYWMQDGGFVLLTLPHFEHEARMTVAGLIPYLKYLATQKAQPAERIEGFFTMEAVERMSGAYYDPTSREVISEDDTNLNEIEMCKEDMHFDLTQLLSEKAPSSEPPPASAPTPAPTSSRPATLPMAVGTLLDGSDSVTTFQTKATAKGSTSTAPKKPPSITPVTSDTASTSHNSLFTDADRQDIQSLQAATKQTQSDIASIQSDLRSLISALALHPAPQARQPGDQAATDAGPPPGQTGDGL